MEFSQEWFNQNLWWIVPLALWELAWKGIALWRAARNDSKPWFVALLVANTLGLLPMLYVFVFGKEAEK